MTSNLFIVYRITNIVERKHYYGYKSCGKRDPKEIIGKTYFSSSSDKEFISDQKENPHKYRYKIVKEFDTRQCAIEFEMKLHNFFDVGINENFYNKSKQTSKGFDISNVSWSWKESSKLKISGEYNPAKKYEVRQKISEKLSGENNPNKCGDAIRNKKKYNDGTVMFYLFEDDERIERLGLVAGETKQVKEKKKNVS